MKPIPEDIADLIERVYRQHDYAAFANINWDVYDKFEAEIFRLFPEFQVVNLTDFNYESCYTYLIVLSKNPDAAALNQDKKIMALREAGVIERIYLKIGIVLPYIHMTFFEDTISQDLLYEEKSDNPFSIHQERAASIVSSFFEKHGYNLLSEELASTIIPDIATELTDIGETTIRDCIFGNGL